MKTSNFKKVATVTLLSTVNLSLVSPVFAQIDASQALIDEAVATCIEKAQIKGYTVNSTTVKSYDAAAGKVIIRLETTQSDGAIAQLTCPYTEREGTFLEDSPPVPQDTTDTSTDVNGLGWLLFIIAFPLLIGSLLVNGLLSWLLVSKSRN